MGGQKLTPSQLAWADKAMSISVVRKPPAIVEHSSHDVHNAAIAKETRERLRRGDEDKKMKDLAERRRNEAERVELNRQRVAEEALEASMDKRLRAAMRDDLRNREAARNKLRPPERLGCNSSRSVHGVSNLERIALIGSPKIYDLDKMESIASRSPKGKTDVYLPSHLAAYDTKVHDKKEEPAVLQPEALPETRLAESPAPPTPSVIVS